MDPKHYSHNWKTTTRNPDGQVQAPLPSKTKQPRPQRQGQPYKIHPSLITLIEHGVFVSGDRLVYYEYPCKINNNTLSLSSSKKRITLSLHECPWLEAKLKVLEGCPVYSSMVYLPNKQAPTQLMMSPSSFKLVADWAREGYADNFEWKHCRGAWSSKHLLVKTMGGRQVRDGVSLGEVREYFVSSVKWDFGMGIPTCKPKEKCRTHFVQPGPESEFSRLVHYLMDMDNNEDEDADEECFVAVGACSYGQLHSPQFHFEAPSSSSGRSVTTSGDISEGESEDEDQKNDENEGEGEDDDSEAKLATDDLDNDSDGLSN